MQAILLAALDLYRRRLSPRLGPACRMAPSCSRYASACIARYGVLVGVRLTAARLRRCNEAWPCADDPVPRPHEIADALAGRLVRVRTFVA
jgi:hypothetical protein